MRKGPFPLQCVSDWFVTQQQVKIWHDDSKYHDKDKLIEWYDGHKKCRALRLQVGKELMPIAWHPSAGLVHVRRRQKRNRKIVGMNIGFFVPGDWIKKVFD